MSEVKREFLFRGKTPGPNGKWVYGSLITAENYCCILEKEEDVHPCDYPFLDGDMGWIDGEATPVIPETVGQYIGMTDENGTKVFEGDILAWVRNDGSVIRYSEKHIYYNECSFCYDEYEDFEFESAYNGTPIDDKNYGITVDAYTIVGNIYDNPELVKGE